MRYAAATTVSVERTKLEIESLLTQYGASEYGSGWMAGKSQISFRIKDLSVRFVLPHPDPSEKRFNYKKVRGDHKTLTQQQKLNAVEQETRRRWRALLLVVKAKLEAVSTGITTLEQEFLAFVVLPSNETFGEWFMDNALRQIRCGEMPKLLAGPKPDDVQDAEIISK